jgi:hypothetical protein
MKTVQEKGPFDLQRKPFFNFLLSIHFWNVCGLRWETHSPLSPSLSIWRSVHRYVAAWLLLLYICKITATSQEKDERRHRIPFYFTDSFFLHGMLGPLYFYLTLTWFTPFYFLFKVSCMRSGNIFFAILTSFTSSYKILTRALCYSIFHYKTTAMMICHNLYSCTFQHV